MGQYIVSPACPLVHLYDCVRSTLLTAEKLAKEGRLREWESVLAASQTEGRGQYGRIWISPPGNIYGAVRLPYVPPFSEDSGSPALGGLLTAAMETFGLQLKIKWPNDLILVARQDAVPYRKIGGILIRERENIIIAGIGINIAAAPPDSAMRAQHAFPAGCLPVQGLAARDISCLAEFWMFLVSSLRRLAANGDAQRWQEITEKRLLFQNETVIIEDGPHEQHCLEGRLLGLDETGGIRIRTASGTVICTSGNLRMPEGKETR